MLRRIEDLNQQSLPDLPGLPADQTSFSEDGESTIAHSPPPRGSSATRIGSPILPPSTSPYTSTPAPSSLFQRSQTTIVPSSASTRYNDTTSTARPPPQLDSLRRSQTRPRAPRARDEVDSTINDTMSESEIKRGGNASSEDGEMMVLSEESDREELGKGQNETTELSRLSEPQEEITETTGEDQTSRDEGETSLESERHPLDDLRGNESLVLAEHAQVCLASPRTYHHAPRADLYCMTETRRSFCSFSSARTRHQLDKRCISRTRKELLAQTLCSLPAGIGLVRSNLLS